MRKANRSAHKSSGLCFVQLLQYPDDYGQSTQVVENITKCSIDNTNKSAQKLVSLLTKIILDDLK